MPVWAAVLVGLGGGVVGTLLSISHQRGAEFRTRMLDAAADFLRAAENTRQGIRAPRGGDFAESVVIARSRLDELFPRLMMIELLYGGASVPSALARAASGHFARAVTEVEALVRSDSDGATSREGGELERIEEAVATASVLLDLFATAAADQVRDTWIRRRLRPRRLTEYRPTGEWPQL